MSKFGERARAKAEKSKHYTTARNHMVNAGGYFALFLGSVVVDHIVDEWKNRKQKPAKPGEDEVEDNETLLDRLLRGF